jgi:hypothetical protein
VGVLRAEEMRACDRVTTERHGVPSIDLMRTALVGGCDREGAACDSAVRLGEQRRRWHDGGAAARE